MKTTKPNAFSMIELLVVIAIISILAITAINTIQSAKIRAQVAKARADFSQLKTAIDSYHIDQSKTPLVFYSLQPVPRPIEDMYELTTPTAYINQIPTSPWQGKNIHIRNMMNDYKQERIYIRTGSRIEDNWNDSPDYIYTKFNPLEPTTDNWLLRSNGPTRLSTHKPYNPSNGVISIGAVMLTQSGATERRY